MPTERDEWPAEFLALEAEAEAEAEIRSEAERLQSLTAKGRELEAITIALRIGRQSDESMGRLHTLDRGALAGHVERFGDEVLVEGGDEV